MNDNELKEYVIQLRRYFHKYPELSCKEINTSKRIAEELEKIGIPYKFSEASPTTIYAQINCDKSNNTVALRADIDALPIDEETNFDFKSTNKGIMHACGHDAHTAMLLGAAKILYNQKDKLKGNVRFIFESGEEVGAYGKKLIEEIGRAHV